MDKDFSAPPQDGAGSAAEMELMRQTIADLQRKLQRAMDEKGQLAADAPHFLLAHAVLREDDEEPALAMLLC
mgnify:CR=1 FL=1